MKHFSLYWNTHSWAFGRISFTAEIIWSLLELVVYHYTVFTSSGKEFGGLFLSSTKQTDQTSSPLDTDQDFLLAMYSLWNGLWPFLQISTLDIAWLLQQSEVWPQPAQIGNSNNIIITIQLDKQLHYYPLFLHSCQWRPCIHMLYTIFV